MRPGAVGNLYEIVQGPGVVAIRYERLHETRIVRMNGSHAGAAVRGHSGDSIGRWEGSDLVVETTNLSERSYTGYPGIWPETLRMVERFSPRDRTHIEVTVRYEDPSSWSKPWSWALRLTRDDRQQLFEYGCHEGNRSLRNMLSAAMASRP